MPYEKGVNTVICNETGCLLRVGAIRLHSGEDLLLGLTEPDEDGNEYGAYVDIEKIARPSAIQYSGIDELETRGVISFHPRGSTPRGKKRVTLGHGVAAPNQFDQQLNELYAREAREDERTRQHSRTRATPAGIGKASVSRGNPS